MAIASVWLYGSMEGERMSWSQRNMASIGKSRQSILFYTGTSFQTSGVPGSLKSDETQKYIPR